MVIRRGRGVRLLGLAALLALLAPAAVAQEQPAAAGAPAAQKVAQPYEFLCPECGVPVRWDHTACPNCGTEFEPLRKRARKGEGGEYEPVGPAEDGARDESPFEDEEDHKPETPEEREDVTKRGDDRVIDEAWPQVQAPQRSRFGLSSYGRVTVLVDEELDGAQPRSVIDFTPRLAKGSYQELHFFYRDVIAQLPIMVKTTVAFQEDLFHLNGQFDADFALREAYVEVEPTPDLALWMGARMYRGDDIYLFDFWPLDDQNTVGAGGALRFLESHRIQLHVGFNRIIDESAFQFQTIEVPREDSVGVREAVFLDRYRMTTSLTYLLNVGSLGFKLHSEVAYLPSGRRQVADEREEKLPNELGFLIGGQLGYNFGPQSFARLFVTYAKGLSAFDELGIPFGFDNDFSLEDAYYIRVAAGGAFDSDIGGLHWGAYWQMFEDADGFDDRDDREQVAFALRPLLYLGDYFRVGTELSMQWLWTDGVFDETGDEETAMITQLSFLVGLAAGKGPYARPALYVLGGINWANEGARLELKRRRLEEPSGRAGVVGIYAEWWF